MPFSACLMALLLGQQIWIYLVRRHSRGREELFRIITENAADMIALVDMKRKRLYNSPSYKRVLGYSPAELSETTSFEQIHPDDRLNVLEAARKTQETGIGKTMQYRMRHKNGTWRILESTASAIRDSKGEVDKLVIVNRDITERKQAEEQLEHNAWHDALTGLPNRRRFVDRLQHSFLQAQRNPEHKYAVLVASIDDFQTFSDAMGSGVANQLMVAVGARLAECLRDNDIVGRPEGELPFGSAVLSRLEGEDFPILVEGISETSDAMRVANRIQAAVAVPFTIENRQLTASVSIGIAPSSTLHGQAEDLLRDAETAVRRAKAMGRSRCEMFDVSMHTRAVARLNLEAGLRRAIDHNQFTVHYQPMLHLEDKRIVGVEALLRWRRTDGLVSPHEFMEVAEQTGLIVPIGQLVIRQACQQLRAWQEKYPQPLRLSIKVSAKQFSHPNFVRELKTAIRESQVDPGTVALELTEGVAMLDPRQTADVLGQLKGIGVRIIIDHFGTGHLPLASLLRFPIDCLKIDRTLTSAMMSDRVAIEILSLIVTVAKKLDLELIAEGIESVVQLEHLKTLGCKFGQGYFFAKPAEAKSVEQLLSRRS